MISNIPFQWRPLITPTMTVEALLLDVLKLHAIRHRIQHLNLVGSKVISPAQFENLNPLTELRELRVTCAFPYFHIPVYQLAR